MSQQNEFEQRVAVALAALGSLTRLRVFKLLVRAGQQGANIGTIQRALSIAPATLAHHLSSLTDAGLVAQKRRGREVICTANYRALNDVLAHVKAECCAGLESNQDAAA